MVLYHAVELPYPQNSTARSPHSPIPIAHNLSPHNPLRAADLPQNVPDLRPKKPKAQRSKNIKPTLPSHLHHPPFHTLRWCFSLSGPTSIGSVPGGSPHHHLRPQPRLHKRTRSSNATTDIWRARGVGRLLTFIHLYPPPTLPLLFLSPGQTVRLRNPSWRRGYYIITTAATTTTTTKAHTIREKATAARMSKGIMENSTSSGSVTTVATATTNSTSPSLQKMDAGQDAQASTPAPAPSEEPEEDLYTICTRLSQKVHLFLETDFSSQLLKGVQRQTRISLGVIEEALRRYKLENLSISFNGGKDCLVLLILFLASLPPYLPSPSQPTSPTSGERGEKINSIYVTTTYPFPQVDAFVQTCIRAYHLSLARYPQPMKSSFEHYLQDNPNVQAIFVGTRRTDPHGEILSHFDVTDHGWPKFMRVHPVVDWGYKDVWGFLRELQVPYCVLYDMGYTSLGGTKDTHPNPALLEGGTEVQEGEGGEKKQRFRPAYELVEDGQERLGRDR